VLRLLRFSWCKRILSDCVGVWWAADDSLRKAFERCLDLPAKHMLSACLQNLIGGTAAVNLIQEVFDDLCWH
jgi:hypothetical protein